MTLAASPPRAPSLQGSRGLAQAAEKGVKLPPQWGIPGRYAAALYMAAVKAGKLEAVEAELGQVANLVAQSQDFGAFISDPSVSASTKAEGLDAILKKMGASDITGNFVGACVEAERGGEGRRNGARGRAGRPWTDWRSPRESSSAPPYLAEGGRPSGCRERSLTAPPCAPPRPAQACCRRTTGWASWPRSWRSLGTLRRSSAARSWPWSPPPTG